MNFKQEFLAALRSGQDYRALLDIVRRYYAQGLPAKETYEILEEIWREFGFHEMEETCSLRDELEYVMERVWYQGPHAGRNQAKGLPAENASGSSSEAP